MTQEAIKSAVRKERRLTVLALGALSFMVSGCCSYSNKFDCPYGEGLGCASVSRVNKMLDANMVDTEDKLVSGSASSPQQQIPLYYGPMRPSQMMTFKGIPVV